jgi:hypothetical protein
MAPMRKFDADSLPIVCLLITVQWPRERQKHDATTPLNKNPMRRDASASYRSHTPAPFVVVTYTHSHTQHPRNCRTPSSVLWLPLPSCISKHSRTKQASQSLMCVFQYAGPPPFAVTRRNWLNSRVKETVCSHRAHCSSVASRCCGRMASLYT